MTTIVLNTLTAAVSEYSWSFLGICPTHAGDADGLYTLGGDKDNGVKIDALVMTGKTLREGILKNSMESAYIACRGPAGSLGVFIVAGSEVWEYRFDVLQAGVSRAKTGRGIKENYLAFGWRNVDGAYAEVDRIDVNVNQSKQRRI